MASSCPPPQPSPTKLPRLSFPTRVKELDSLPAEIIMKIAGYIAPSDALSARLVCRRFATTFGDNQVWRVYYETLGLQAPQVSPNRTLGSEAAAAAAVNGEVREEARRALTLWMLATSE